MAVGLPSDACTASPTAGLSPFQNSVTNPNFAVNLPATVEMSTPNIYADQVEYFATRISRRDSVVISSSLSGSRTCTERSPSPMRSSDPALFWLPPFTVPTWYARA